MRRAALPQEVVQGARTRSRESVDHVIPSVPAHRVLLEAAKLLFVSQHAAVVGVADVIRVGQPGHVVVVAACKRATDTLGSCSFANLESRLPPSGRSLTVSGEQVPEVDGERHPVLVDEGLPVAPDADVHGAGARLRRQPGEVDGVVGEVVRVPALAFVGGEPAGEEEKHQRR